MKKILYLFLIFIISNCTKEKEVVIEEKKSIHQQDFENAKLNSSNINIEIIENKILVDKAIGKFRNPKFSVDGKKIFFTTEDFSQLWIYDLTNETINKLISLPQCGVNFQISKTGEYIYFRNKVTQGKKTFSILSYSLNTKKINVIYNSDKRLSPPLLVDSLIYLVEDGTPLNINLSNSKISKEFKIPFLFVNNNVFLKASKNIDTLKIPNNIKPIESYYSKDLENIFLLTNSIGFLIYNKFGEPINNFKKAGFLSKLYKSNLVIFTKEIFNDQQLKDSKMFIGFLDGDKEIEILEDEKYQKLYPDWSPIENKIVFATEFGEIRIISFNISKK
ncbi:MAG: hypothetical protein IPH62_18300 [Ignavibacteriae bacterium]|nr:hypothetical protein [Ignavibacteriota bacterium]